MTEPQNINDVIKILRTADIATLWEYSQHMAGVLESVSQDLDTFHGLIWYARNVTLEKVDEPLTEVQIRSMVPEELLRDLLGVLSRGVGD